MCGRFTLRTPTETIADIFAGIQFPEIPPNYNVAPTHMVATIRQKQEREFAWLRWGLLPSWAKDKKIGARMINARCETVHEKPAYRAAFKKRRCLVLADGFYEWLSTPEGKQPMYISRIDGQPFAMAGLWESNRQLEEEALQTCTVITTNANELMAPIHDRMPAILDGEKVEMWLDPEFEDYERLRSILAPFAPNQLQAIAVSRKVNKVSYTSADSIEPSPTQQNLF